MENQLYYQTLEPNSFGLLNEVMGSKPLQDAGFSLAGGTALALQLGHRMSTDLDLFSPKPFDPRQMQDVMRGIFSNRIEFQSINELGFRGFVDGVKFDMIHYPFPPKQPVVEADGIRMLSVETISAMKVHAVANRGLRRDFTDLAEILQRIPLKDVLVQYHQQFTPSPTAFRHTMQAMTYFGDAERTPQKIAMLNDRSWDSVKKIIQTRVSNPSVVNRQAAPLTVKPTNPHRPKSTLATANTGIKPTVATTTAAPRNTVARQAVHLPKQKLVGQVKR